MPISFPKVTVNKLSASQAIGADPQKVLFVGQKLAAGTATSGELIENIGNDNSEDTLFGQGSMISGMIRNFKLINKVSRIDAISLDDAVAGVQAAGAVVFSGTASATGTITVTVGSYRAHTYILPVVATDTATNIGDDLVALITADLDAPFTAVNTTGSVAITARHKGTEYNNTTIKVTGSATGLSYTVTAFTAGATNPTLTNIFDVIGNMRYQTIVFPYTYGTTFVTDLLEARFNIANVCLDGVGITSATDTYANLVTLGNSLNKKTLCIHGNETINDSYYKGNSSKEFNCIIASQFAAVRALRLDDDSNLTQYVLPSGGALDIIGGSHLASKPYANTLMPYLPLKDTGKVFTQTEIEELKDAGIFVIENNVNNTDVICGEVVTTYKTDSASNEDITWKYLNYVDTMSVVAEYFFDNLKADYAQARLTEGALVEGYAMANEAKISASCCKYYKDLSEIVLVESGRTAEKYFKDNLIITIDKAEGSITIQSKILIVTQLRELTATLQVSFSVNS